MRARFLSLFLFAAACGDTTRPPAKPAPAAAAAAALPHGCAELIPHEGGNLLIRASWRGQPVSMVYDTGGDSTGLSTNAAALLQPVPGVKVRYASASGTFLEAPVFDVSELAIGGIELAPLRAHTIEVADSTDFEFNLGREALAPYAVEIDWPHQRLCLHPGGLAGGDDLRWSPMTRASAGGRTVDIVVDAEIAGVPVNGLILDTGAGVSCINRDLLERFEHRRRDEVVQSIDGTGVVRDEYFVDVKKLCALGVCEPDQILMPGDDLSPLVGYSTQGILGIPFFHRRRVVLDFPGARIGVGEPVAPR